MVQQAGQLALDQLLVNLLHAQYEALQEQHVR
jgi:hypothetical protein